MKRKCVSLLTAAVCGASVLTAMPQMPANAASDCTVTLTKTYQTIQGFGGINLPEWAGSDMTEAQVQKAFGNGKDELGLTILRIYVSDDSGAWKNAVPTAKRAQALGATIFASPWYPPAAIRNTVNGGINGGKYQLKKDKWAEYAAHLNSYIKYMAGQDINLYAISIQNEPDYAQDWTYWSASDLASFIAQYGKAVTQGTETKLMSPESFQYKKDIYNAILGNSAAKANVDVYGTHFYGTQRYEMDFPALENSGKPLWMTEVYVPNSSSDADTWPEAVQVAENIHNGLVVGNFNAYVWWFIRRKYSPMKENGNISKRGYCMAQYSKWVRPGAVRVDATETPNNGAFISAYKNKDGNAVIVAVNKGNEYTQKFKVAGGTIKSIDRYRTSATENIAETKNIEFSGNSFSASLPGNSVSTFVIALDGAEPLPDVPDQPDPPQTEVSHYQDGFESGTGEWIGRGGASVETDSSLAFAGSKSLLVTGRTSAWHGAARPLDSDFYTPGKEFSFSANVAYTDGTPTDTFYMKLQYKDASDKTQYATIAEATAAKGEWVQLSNTNYKIPSDAANLQIYIETAESTIDFYVDDAASADAGTVIKGAGSGKDEKLLPGDVSCDGIVNAADLSAMKAGIRGSFSGSLAERNADVDQNGKVNAEDAEKLRDYLLTKAAGF